MEKMLQLAYDNKIIVEEFYLNPPLMGIYICQKKRPPLIGLNTTIETIAQKRSIMAEELGHHFTSVGNCLPCQFYHYAARLSISKAEYKALRWAANYLIPEDNLLDALKEGIDTPSELAEHFMVTAELISLRLKLFSKPVSER